MVHHVVELAGVEEELGHDVVLLLTLDLQQLLALLLAGRHLVEERGTLTET